MKRYLFPVLTFITGFLCAITITSYSHKQEGFIIQHEKDIEQKEPGSHNGGGQTLAFSFFNNVPDMHLVFRKRILLPGSSIGYHLQNEDEIYYILKGKGELNMNGHIINVQEGDAILTRPRNSHGLKPAGNDSLSVLINYSK